MLHFYDRATIKQALTLELDPQLHQLLTLHIGSLTEDLIDFSEYLVIDPMLDTEADIVRAVGFSPLINATDGISFGSPGFHPAHDWLHDHGGYFELIVTFGSAFAYVLLIRDHVEADHRLLRFCRLYSKDGGPRAA